MSGMSDHRPEMTSERMAGLFQTLPKENVWLLAHRPISDPGDGPDGLSEMVKATCSHLKHAGYPGKSETNIGEFFMLPGLGFDLASAAAPFFSQRWAKRRLDTPLNEVDNTSTLVGRAWNCGRADSVEHFTRVAPPYRFARVMARVLADTAVNWPECMPRAAELAPWLHSLRIRPELIAESLVSAGQRWAVRDEVPPMRPLLVVLLERHPSYAGVLDDMVRNRRRSEISEASLKEATLDATWQSVLHQHRVRQMAVSTGLSMAP